MEERLEIVLNEIFLKYGFLFDKKSELEDLVSDITDRYLESVRLDVSIFNTYLMEIESRVRKCLALKIKENPFKVLNSYINKNLSNAKNNIEALDSISYLCDISGYKISNVMIKELLSNNKVLNKLVSSAVKDNMIYLKNNGIDVDLGLSFIGDETSYKELLLEFKNGFINQMNEIKTLYENKDIENYGIKVHALKSNCKTFGIMTFANMAYEHEMAAKNGDINFINQNIMAKTNAKLEK